MDSYKGSVGATQEECVRWQGLGAHASDYQALLCDVWGVVHNGVAAYDSAVGALRQFRAQGGKVVLISNAPRPSVIVARQLEKLGVGHDAFDAVLTSGDLTQAALIEGSYGRKCYHLGPQRDLGLFEGASVDQVKLTSANFILCTGFENDERQNVEDYRRSLEEAVSLGLVFVCANPDRLVERDGKLIPCAGQLADFYESLGGQVVYFGKPYAPIYDHARKLLGEVAAHRVLAIGDGLATDIEGALNQGFHALFIAAGIASGIASDVDNDDAAISHACRKAGVMPQGWMAELIW